MSDPCTESLEISSEQSLSVLLQNKQINKDSIRELRHTLMFTLVHKPKNCDSHSIVIKETIDFQAKQQFVTGSSEGKGGVLSLGSVLRA